jgi:hypothetical protein
VTALRSAAGALVLAVAATGAFVSAGTARNPESPPPAHTGGFGEPTCLACHFEGEINEGAGGLSVSGVADRTRAGVHTLTIRLEHPNMAVGGFMLSARFTDGAAAGQQAGSLRGGDGVALSALDDVQYASHTLASTRATDGEREWRVEWDAREVPADSRVVFHVAANAGNDDASPFGDYVYATSITTRILPGEK